MDAKYIAKPYSAVSWNTVPPVERQYITSTLTTLTYSTTGVMSSITNTTYTTTARGTVVTSDVSYSYNIGTLYDTSSTSTTVSLPDGRTATSFGSISTTLKYSYYPDRKQTGEKYVAVSNNYVGNIYSTIGSSSRGTCMLFGGEVNSTINTYRSSIYTPAYMVDTTAEVSTTVQTTTEIPVYSTRTTSNFTYYLFSPYSDSTFTTYSMVNHSSNGKTSIFRPYLYINNGRDVFDEKFTLTSGGISYWGMSYSSTTQPSRSSFSFPDVFMWKVSLSRDFKIGQSLITYTDSFSSSDINRRLVSTRTVMVSGYYTNFVSTFEYTNRLNEVTYNTNIWVYTNTTTTIETNKSVNTTSVLTPYFDGLVSAHNIAESMYYSMHYTYPFSESKTSYILHSDSITHQYYVSTTKEVRV